MEPSPAGGLAARAAPARTGPAGTGSSDDHAPGGRTRRRGRSGRGAGRQDWALVDRPLRPGRLRRRTRRGLSGRYAEFLATDRCDGRGVADDALARPAHGRDRRRHRRRRRRVGRGRAAPAALRSRPDVALPRSRSTSRAVSPRRSTWAAATPGACGAGVTAVERAPSGPASRRGAEPTSCPHVRRTGGARSGSLHRWTARSRARSARAGLGTVRLPPAEDEAAARCPSVPGRRAAPSRTRPAPSGWLRTADEPRRAAPTATVRSLSPAAAGRWSSGSGTDHRSTRRCLGEVVLAAMDAAEL